MKVRVKQRCAPVLTFIAAALGIPATDAQTPSFKSAVSLLTVDVTVLDQQDRPALGLTEGDFEVKVNGVLRPVRAVTFVEVSRKTSSDPSSISISPRADRNRAESASDPATQRAPRIFVVMVDDLSMTAAELQRAFPAVARFVEELPGTDSVGFTTTSGLLTAVNPTTDRPAVLDAMKKVVGLFVDPRFVVEGPVVGLQEAVIVDDGSTGVLRQIIMRECFGGNPSSAVSGMALDRLLSTFDCAREADSRARGIARLVKRTAEEQLRAYVAAISAMRHSGGVKHLVILTRGFGAGRTGGDMIQVARAAAVAGVQLSVVAEDPDEIDMRLRSSRASSVARADGRAFASSAQTMAELAGGQFYRVIGSSDRTFDRILAVASAVYRLGIELPADTAPGAEVTLAVRVLRSGITARASHYAVAPTSEAAVSIDQKLRDVVTRGERRSEFPVRVGTTMRQAASNQIEVGVDVEVPPSVPGPLSVVFGVVDEAGLLKMGRRVVPPDAGGAPYRMFFLMPLSDGRYRVRFAAADARGALASVESTVTALVGTIGPLKVSDVLLSWVDREGLVHPMALDNLPAVASRLQAAIELYTDKAEALGNLSAKLVLLRADSRSVVSEREMELVPQDGFLRAEARFPMEEIAPGAYIVQSVIMLGGRTAGVRETMLLKR